MTRGDQPLDGQPLDGQPLDGQSLDGQSLDGRAVRGGSSPAIPEIRDLLVAHTSAGTLRIVLQQLTLREDGREVGVHEVIDAVTDVGGNLVTFSLRASVHGDLEDAARLETAIRRLREDIAADPARPIDSLVVLIDGDGHHRVNVDSGLEVSPQDVATHPALRDGAHHITHESPALDDLRDRLASPPPGVLRRGRDLVRGWLRRSV
ncbi:hypothetical protein [Brachybacterium sp. AOP3-A1-3]|uniref:hypothetical protein n=1 Tax=Brachybacterium sp. AOP3-A1-3 TaxID=3457699 RepID=UPI004033541E